jgi:hypothetical protein
MTPGVCSISKEAESVFTFASKNKFSLSYFNFPKPTKYMNFLPSHTQYTSYRPPVSDGQRQEFSLTMFRREKTQWKRGLLTLLAISGYTNFTAGYTFRRDAESDVEAPATFSGADKAIEVWEKGKTCLPEYFDMTPENVKASDVSTWYHTLIERKRQTDPLFQELGEASYYGEQILGLPNFRCNIGSKGRGTEMPNCKDVVGNVKASNSGADQIRSTADNLAEGRKMYFTVRGIDYFTKTIAVIHVSSTIMLNFHYHSQLTNNRRCMAQPKQIFRQKLPCLLNDLPTRQIPLQRVFVF